MRRHVVAPPAALPVIAALGALLAAALAAVACDRFLPAREPATEESGPAAVIDATVASADGVPIHYHAEGRGSPALVFIHGWSCDATHWDAQVRHFAPRHRVVAIDLAGHGASGAGRAEWTIPAFAADVRAVVEALGLDRVVLIGHSMGGWVMLEAAALMPDRVAALVAVDTLQDADQKFGPQEVEAFLAPFRADFRKATAGFVRSFFPAGADPALVEKVASDMASAPPEVALPSLRAAVTYDLAAGLARTSVPIRCLNSARHPTNVEGNRRHHERFDAVIIPDVGHFPMLEAAATFNRLLEEAVRDLAASP